MKFAVAPVLCWTAVVWATFCWTTAVQAAPPPREAEASLPVAGPPPLARTGRLTEAAWFVPGRAFAPLVADPRWPSFNIGYARVIRSEGTVFEDVYSNLWPVGFGETVAFYRGPVPWADAFEVGAQAALFAVLDLAEESVPLINADYQGGGYVSARWGDYSALFRLYHESSHLGDELLIMGPTLVREDTTQDAFELLGSRLFRELDTFAGRGDLRVYGGVGNIFRSFGNTDYGNWLFQYGFEWAGNELPYRMPGGLTAYPMFAVDIQHLDGRDYQPDFSLAGGLRLQARRGGRTDVQLTYYNGRNPNGQFFVDDFETVGLNFRVNF